MRFRILLFLAISALLVAVACGGSGSGSTTNRTTNNQPATGSTVQVSMADDPGDRVASLSILINSVSLTSNAGATVSLISSPTTIEVSSLAGTTTPLGTVTVPAGNYNKLTIALGGATITAVDPSTGTTVQKTFPAPANAFTITLTPVFVSDGSPLVINIDMDVHSSVGIDSNGTLTFNPLFLVSHGRMTGPPQGAPPNPFTGGLDRAFGVVTGVSGSNFTITTAVGQRSLTFATSSSTVFRNVSGVAGLQTGMLVMVGGQAQSDGTLLALGVAVVNGLRSGTGAIGIVARTTGTPVTQFSLLAHGMTSSSMLTGIKPVPQAVVTVDVAGTTMFRVDDDQVDMTGMSFTFNASTLSPAQVVEVDTAAPLAMFGGTMMGMPVLGGMTASQVQLEQQPVRGTISNLATNSFSLTVPGDSVFAILAKTTTITVYKQAGTVLDASLVLANGQKVVVRGLLFNNSGYQMVATRIAALQ